MNGSSTNDVVRENILAVEGVTKRFGDFIAVDDVSFELGRGESLGVVGESGSGKTTVARMIVGLETATTGGVRHVGAESRSRKDAARRVQMIFQDPYHSFDPRVTVGDAVGEPLRLHTRLSAKERKRRVEELLDSVGLSPKQAQARPRELSGGQRQRAAIARAIGIEPAVLVLDEAVAALDVSIQAQILVLLDELRRETGMAYVFVSHDLAVVRYITDQSIVMRKGRIVERGRTEDILRSPGHPYTRLLLDSVPRTNWDFDALRRDRRALEAAESESSLP